MGLVTSAGPPGSGKIGQLEAYHLAKGLSAYGHYVQWFAPEDVGTGIALNSAINLETVENLSFLVHNPAVHLGDFVLSRVVGSKWSDLMRILRFGPFIPQIYLRLKRRAQHLNIIHALPMPFSFCHFAYRAATESHLPFVLSPYFPARLSDSQRNVLYWNSMTIGLLKKADALQVPTRSERDAMVRLGVSPTRIRVIPPCIDIAEFAVANGNRFREEYGLEGARVVLFMGRKTIAKGALHLAAAMKTVRREFPNTILVAVGTRTPEWMAATRAKPSGTLIDLEYLFGQNKVDAFDACDVFAMPSISDDFGRVYAEAWLRKKPVLACGVGGIDEVVKDRVRGVLVKFGDVEEISSALVSLLGSPRTAGRLGQAGFSYAKNNLDLRKTIPQLVELYDTAIEVASGTPA